MRPLLTAPADTWPIMVVMEVVDAIANAFGLDLVAVEPAITGQGRTVFASTVDGIPVVVKWSADDEWAEWLPTVIRNSEALIKRGYPSARTVASGAVDGVGYAWVQERLPGSPMQRGVDALLLDQVLDAIDLQADADKDIEIPDTGEWSWVSAVVFDDHAGWWKAARSINQEVNELCDRLGEWVRELPSPQRRKDWVHLDLNFSNLLSLNGQLTGIIDLDHLGIGDRSVDIACLAFGYVQLRLRFPQKGLVPPVSLLRERVLNISGESGWRQAVTYNVISNLGWVSTAGLRTPIGEATASSRQLLEASGCEWAKS
jgi:hypothetical protein